MQTDWEKVESGRYACRVNGSVLQVMYAPDKSSDDRRPYISIVDKQPLSKRFWTPREAKTAAMDAIGFNGQQRMEKMRGSRAEQTAAAILALEYQPKQDDVINVVTFSGPELDAAPKPQPQPDPAPIEPEPDPAPAYDPPPDIPPPDTDCATINRVSIVLTGELSGPDAIALVNQAQAAIQLLQELGTVQCHLAVPDGIRI